ncbi:hypothetical protein HELRODRAFT_178264 [Helobdella robusta]|uniref:Uncharacterized protein n=1 Tax=Helobdella robusta TaxID=6412 RepID=T1FD04_HELRO|nr:hypothetical protein HELRODRAFT_178264 [Helobdella robusta]ESN97155.1 hypothetical protein HELRODRAFT_178264 [Helobdella robusta]
MADEGILRRGDGADEEGRFDDGEQSRSRRTLLLVMAGSGMIGAVVCTILVASVFALAASTTTTTDSTTTTTASTTTTALTTVTTTNLATTAQPQQLIRFSLSMENVANYNYCFFAVSYSSTYSIDIAVPLYNNQSIPEDVISGGNYKYKMIGLVFNPSNNQTNTTFDFIKIEVAYFYFYFILFVTIVEERYCSGKVPDTASAVTGFDCRVFSAYHMQCV